MTGTVDFRLALIFATAASITPSHLGNLTVTPLNGLRFCAGVNRFPQDEENQLNSKDTIVNESFWSRLARDQPYIHIVCSRSYHLLPMAAPKVVIAPDAM